jgi:hypothetical protein
MFDEDQIRLEILHAITKFLQVLARVIGEWAIAFENAYNKYVDTLH